MTGLLWLSIAINALLCIALMGMYRTFKIAIRAADCRIQRGQELAQSSIRDNQNLYSDYCMLAKGVSISLEAIREDIDRNYHHTHEDHLLDRMAFALRKEVEGNPRGCYEISLHNDDAMQIQVFGGFVSSENTINLGGMLEFAWQLHASSRARSQHLADVVRQPCRNIDHVAWLSKTLAIYELMCGRSKQLAIDRLSAVIAAWKHEPEFIAARYVEDVRHSLGESSISTEIDG